MTTTGSESDMATGSESDMAAPPSGEGGALLCLHGPLRKLAGDRAEHQLSGATVADLLRSLESQHPDLRGWILDERGRIRRHINVFVGGERGQEQTPVRPGDRVEVLPAITGG